MLGRIFAVLTLVSVAAFGLRTEAAPADDILPKPDPKNSWRIVHLDDERSTTKCIGNPITPLCTIETWMGCLVREDRNLCAQADVLIWSWPWFDAKVVNRYFTRYRVARSDILTKKTIPRSEDWRPGDLRIMVRSENCFLFGDRTDCPREPPEYHGYVLRKIDGRWWIVDRIAPPRR